MHQIGIGSLAFGRLELGGVMKIISFIDERLLITVYSKITTAEKKTGFLLIETFRKLKLWPPGDDPWWPFLYVRGSKNFSFQTIWAS